MGAFIILLFIGIIIYGIAQSDDSDKSMKVNPVSNTYFKKGNHYDADTNELRFIHRDPETNEPCLYDKNGVFIKNLYLAELEEDAHELHTVIQIASDSSRDGICGPRFMDKETRAVYTVRKIKSNVDDHTYLELYMDVITGEFVRLSDYERFNPKMSDLNYNYRMYSIGEQLKEIRHNKILEYKEKTKDENLEFPNRLTNYRNKFWLNSYTCKTFMWKKGETDIYEWPNYFRDRDARRYWRTLRDNAGVHEEVVF